MQALDITFVTFIAKENLHDKRFGVEVLSGTVHGSSSTRAGIPRRPIALQTHHFTIHDKTLTTRVCARRHCFTILHAVFCK